MKKTSRVEIDRLKKQWLEDPFRSLEEIAKLEEFLGFEEQVIKSEREAMRKQNCSFIDQEKKKKEEAEKLGLVGLYELIIENKELINRQEMAIRLLAENKPEEARIFLQEGFSTSEEQDQ